MHPAVRKALAPSFKKKPSIKPPAATRMIVAQAKLATQLYSLGATKTLKHNVLKRAKSIKTLIQTPPAATSLLYTLSSRLATSRALANLFNRKKLLSCPKKQVRWQHTRNNILACHLQSTTIHLQVSQEFVIIITFLTAISLPHLIPCDGIIFFQPSLNCSGNLLARMIPTTPSHRRHALKHACSLF